MLKQIQIKSMNQNLAEIIDTLKLALERNSIKRIYLMIFYKIEHRGKEMNDKFFGY